VILPIVAQVAADEPETAAKMVQPMMLAQQMHSHLALH
jgi:hypothetical protein